MMNLGDTIRTIWEAKIGSKVKCKSCVDFLNSLNGREVTDPVTLIAELDEHLPFPSSIRDRLKTADRQALIAATISGVVNVPAMTPAKPRTPKRDRVKKAQLRSGDGQVTVVIPCHNYARFLGECIASIKASSVHVAEIIVVDDSSDDNPKQHCDDVTYHRVEFKNQAATCREGFKHVKTRYVAFIDADDKVHPEYFETAVSKMEADRLAACAFPVLIAFGNESGPKHDTDKAKPVVKWEDIEIRNWCSAGSVYRTEIMRQALALDTDRVPGCGCSDWITIRTIMRAGPWHAVKTNVPLYYRIHGHQMHSGDQFGKYHLQANHAKEIVTIVIAFSGRWNCWEHLRKWILTQDWPRNQVRLMILNSTHTNLRVSDFGLEDWDSNIQIERIDVGYPTLADQERRDSMDVVRSVEAAVAGLYNRAIKMAYGEWLLFIEDDVIPQQPDTIRKLFANIQPRVACVSGLYRHRYEDKAVAFSASRPGELPMLSLDGSDTEKVFGSGFGCLLARRSVLSKYGLAGDGAATRFYDVAIGADLADTGWEWMLDRRVKCDHLTQVTDA